jgi:hypothetical protein
MALDTTKYMLFPYTFLSDAEYRHLSLLLPGLSMLQVIRPPAIPKWLQETVTGWPSIIREEEIETIALYLKGYREFAAVHGENSVLASLSLEQISRDFAESRFRIQTELKRDHSHIPDDRKVSLIEAAVFLEMARDLDEKEIELEAGLVRIDSLEGEFREILGISDDEELADTMETLVPPLRAEKAYLSFMLPKRIEAWLGLLSNRTPAVSPILVTTSEQVVQELFDLPYVKHDRAGNAPEPVRIALGLIPAMDDLAIEDFLSLLSEPEASRLLTSYWRCVENTLLSPDDRTGREQLDQATDILQDYLRNYRGEIGLSGEREISMDLVFEDQLKWNAVREHSGRVGGSEQPVENAFSDDLMKILVCRF